MWTAESPLLPGVERLIKHLHANGVPMAVATSSHQRGFLLKTSKHRELFGLFGQHIITGCMVRAGMGPRAAAGPPGAAAMPAL